jgi:hypothetical protein
LDSASLKPLGNTSEANTNVQPKLKDGMLIQALHFVLEASTLPVRVPRGFWDAESKNHEENIQKHL